MVSKKWIKYPTKWYLINRNEKLFHNSSKNHKIGICLIGYLEKWKKSKFLFGISFVKLCMTFSLTLLKTSREHGWPPKHSKCTDLCALCRIVGNIRCISNGNEYHSNCIIVLLICLNSQVMCSPPIPHNRNTKPNDQHT